MNDVTIVKYSYAILTVCYALRLHVVEMKALFCSLFPLCTRLAVVAYGSMDKPPRGVNLPHTSMYLGSINFTRSFIMMLMQSS